VVNMFLTGFDATTLNTLWVDKNLKMHGLIQAFSRTNRILNSIKTFGNIVCFRNLQKRVDAAISLFGDKNAGGIVLLQKFDAYYHGYVDMEDKPHLGYVDMIDELTTKFPLSEPQIVGEQNQKDFIALFGAILRMRNLLSSFDEFKGQELISERDLQDYLGRYQDLRDEWRRKREDKDAEDITDDLVFEVELIRQIEINIDYILLLVKKYHDTHCTDKEVLITIQKAIDASPELRSKKALIETFIAGLLKHMDSTAVPHAWNVEGSTYKVELVGDDLGYLIGRRGDTLDAIQHLANYSINRDVEGHVRINVDAECYREKREDSLRRYARKKAQQVLKARRRTTLEPMNAYERHVIHATLQEMDNITTYSTGTEPNRRVVIEYVR